MNDPVFMQVSHTRTDLLHDFSSLVFWESATLRFLSIRSSAALAQCCWRSVAGTVIWVQGCWGSGVARVQW